MHSKWTQDQLAATYNSHETNDNMKRILLWVNASTNLIRCTNAIIHRSRLNCISEHQSTEHRFVCFGLSFDNCFVCFSALYGFIPQHYLALAKPKNTHIATIVAIYGIPFFRNEINEANKVKRNTQFNETQCQWYRNSIKLYECSAGSCQLFPLLLSLWLPKILCLVEFRLTQNARHFSQLFSHITPNAINSHSPRKSTVSICLHTTLSFAVSLTHGRTSGNCRTMPAFLSNQIKFRLAFVYIFDILQLSAPHGVGLRKYSQLLLSNLAIFMFSIQSVRREITFRIATKLFRHILVEIHKI